MVFRGGWLLLALLVALTVSDLGRSTPLPTEGSTFFIEEGIPLQLTDDQGRLDGIHQINDATALLSVINMAGLRLSPNVRRKLLKMDALEAGKYYKFSTIGRLIVHVEDAWMPAVKRITLAIPLATEQMTFDDWCDLSGVGPVLAARIIRYRQEYGGFDRFEDLERVQGIGPKSLKAWRPFFR